MKKYILLFLSIVVFCNFTKEKKETQVKSADEFPIMAWIGVPESETTVERFRELKESGININFSSYSSIEAVEKALDVAQQAGVKLMPSFPELRSEPEKSAKRLMKHPALAGYHLTDEPGAASFPELGKWVKRIQSVDKHHGCYINLFPNYAPAEVLIGKDGVLAPGEDPYAKHVDMFLKEVPVPFISFDFYPVVEENGVRMLRTRWYQNLEIVADASRKSGRPFWAFALAIAHKPYPIPTVAELRLQMFSNLAYGAQTLQYFTYWHPGDDTPWDFHDSPIKLDGSRSVVYDRIKTVNREIHSLSRVFKGAKLVTVWHTGNQLPEGTRPIDKLPKQIQSLETKEGTSIVSVLINRGKQYLVIVNSDFQNPLTFDIKTDNKVRKVLKNGTSAPAGSSSGTEVVAPGDIIIYSL